MDGMCINAEMKKALSKFSNLTNIILIDDKGNQIKGTVVSWCGERQDHKLPVAEYNIKFNLTFTDMQKTVFFVGMHNKPGMKPLDSKTRTGKVVDLIIDGTKLKCVKTNLCEMERMPNDDETSTAAIEWFDKYSPKANDIIVLLGKWTHEHFRCASDLQIVKVGHPAAVFSKTMQSKYIAAAIRKIKQLS